MFLVTMRGSKRKLELILLDSKSNNCAIKLTHSTEHIMLKTEGEEERVSLPALHYGSAFHFGDVIMDGSWLLPALQSGVDDGHGKWQLRQLSRTCQSCSCFSCVPIAVKRGSVLSDSGDCRIVCSQGQLWQMQKKAMWPESLDDMTDTSQRKRAEGEGWGDHRKHRKLISWWSWRNSLCWGVYWGRRMENWRQNGAKLLSCKYWGVGSLWVYIDLPGSCVQRSLGGTAGCVTCFKMADPKSLALLFCPGDPLQLKLMIGSIILCCLEPLYGPHFYFSLFLLATFQTVNLFWNIGTQRSGKMLSCASSPGNDYPSYLIAA